MSWNSKSRVFCHLNGNLHCHLIEFLRCCCPLCSCDYVLFLGYQYSWWRHQMETFSALLTLCVENSPVTGEFPSQKASDAELWCFLRSAPWINGSVNNCEAGDLKRHWTHCDVIVMCYFWPFIHDIFPDYVITPVAMNLLWSIWMMHVPTHIQAQ